MNEQQQELINKYDWYKKHLVWLGVLEDENTKGERANLREADLRGADLRGADLRGADLRGVNLRGADLRGADLHWVNLRGVNLRGVNLRGANLPNYQKWASSWTIEGVIKIGCQSKTIEEWEVWFASHDEYQTKRNTADFERIEADFQHLKRMYEIYQKYEAKNES